MLSSMLGKNIIAISSNRVDTYINRSWFSTCCRDDHKQSKAMHRYMTWTNDEFLSLKTLSFLHSQSDQIIKSAPTLIRIFNLLSIPCSQLLMILAGYKVEATWMIDHIDLANLHWKNKCLIVSSWWDFGVCCENIFWMPWSRSCLEMILFITVNVPSTKPNYWLHKLVPGLRYVRIRTSTVLHDFITCLIKLYRIIWLQVLENHTIT
jgi:hypothetical protein